MTEQPADHSASAPQTRSAQQTVRWTTPPTDGGERLDGRSVALVSADRVLTGRRGQAEGSLEVLGGADDAGPGGGLGGHARLDGAGGLGGAGEVAHGAIMPRPGRPRAPRLHLAAVPADVAAPDPSPHRRRRGARAGGENTATLLAEIADLKGRPGGRGEHGRRTPPEPYLRTWPLPARP